LFGKSRGILAGVPFFTFAFESLGCTVEWHKEEGSLVDPAAAQGGKVLVAVVRGPARLILLGERTALNTLSRASAVATAADEAVQVAKEHSWHGHVAGTRKTTPGFRIVEKYALLVGGASTHRLDLSNMVMLKDNHIWSAGNITKAVQHARKAAGFSSKIEVECQSLEEAHEAASAGADIVMLDNMEPGQLKMAAAMLKASHPSLLIEASGGITLETMPNYFSPHVDIVSRGQLTQGYGSVDFSLKIINGAASPMKVKRKYTKRAKANSSDSSERTAIPGAYRCVKSPAIAYRLTANLEARDESIPPVLFQEQVNNCVECSSEDGSSAFWLRLDLPGIGARFLPTFLDGEALFEPVLEPTAAEKKASYEV